MDICTFNDHYLNPFLEKLLCTTKNTQQKRKAMDYQRSSELNL